MPLLRSNGFCTSRTIVASTSTSVTARCGASAETESHKMFSDKAKTELAAKLSPTAVKSRQQGGSKVSYIEGWHAIAEANRIFGFDNWTRETLDIKCVSEKEREIG